MATKCPTCDGKGVIKCKGCNGTGSLGIIHGKCTCDHGYRRCPNCKGTGKV